jgi:hypothetical protein
MERRVYSPNGIAVMEGGGFVVSIDHSVKGEISTNPSLAA